jgi:hypothetical protein
MLEARSAAPDTPMLGPGEPAMIPLIPFSLSHPTTRGLLPEGELCRAHAVAPRALQGLRSIGLPFWFGRGVSAVSATAIGLLGHILFDWPPFLFAVAIAVDASAALLADVVRHRLAPAESATELGVAMETEYVLHTEAAMQRAGRWTGPPGPPTRVSEQAGRFTFPPRQRFLYQGPALGAAPERVLWTMLGNTALVVLPLLAIMAYVVDARDEWPTGLDALLLGAIVCARLADAVASALTARRDPGAAHPTMLPSSPPAAVAIYLTYIGTGMAIVIGSLVLGTRTLPPLLADFGVLMLYLLAQVAVLAAWRRHAGRAAKRIEGFAASDIEHLRRRWATMNGDDPTVTLPRAGRTGTLAGSGTQTTVS